jgi:molecular chaperone HtpG
MAVFSANDKVNVRNQLHIPNDLSFSILSKLPIKSLKRFGCVCKSWSLLFDNPIFMTLYRKHFLTKDHSYYDDTSVLFHQKFSPWDGYYWEETFELYCISDERFENRVKLDWPSVKLDAINRLQTEYDSGFDILGSGSVHGTLCLFCANRENTILWKPSTKEFKFIPPSPFQHGPYWFVSVDYHGFGYDRVRDDYKVLCYGQLIPDFDVQSREDIPSNRYIWEIYSLRSNCWRILDVNKDH